MGFAFLENEPAKGRFHDDVVMNLRSGYAVGGRPVALSAWRFTSGDPDVMEAIAENFGGEVSEWEATKEDILEVHTTVSSLNVVLDGPNAIRTGMVMFGRSGPPIRQCDGIVMSGEDQGHACMCPSGLQERKDAAQKGRACQPSIEITFRLESMPDLGLGRFRSGSWTLAADIGKAEAALEKIDGPAKAVLKLEQITTKTGKQFTKPVLTITGKA